MILIAISIIITGAALSSGVRAQGASPEPIDVNATVPERDNQGNGPAVKFPAADAAADKDSSGPKDEGVSRGSGTGTATGGFSVFELILYALIITLIFSCLAFWLGIRAGYIRGRVHK